MDRSFLRTSDCAALGAFLTLARPVAASEASADPERTADGKRLVWRAGWRRVGVPEYVATGALGAGILASHWLPAASNEPWSGPVLHDDWTRDRLRIDSRAGRSRAARVSDVLDGAAIAHLFVVDTLLVTAIGDGNGDVAWQMLVINAQAYAMSSFLNRVTKRLTQRARPYVEVCEKDPEADDRCGSGSRYESFYSGHTTSTATSAGLICAHHTQLALYGGGLADTATCLTAIGFTTATGALRIASDNHWATDVLVGHVTGYLAGYLVPTLLYYRDIRTKPLPERSGVQAMGFVLPRPDGVELAVAGMF